MDRRFYEMESAMEQQDMEILPHRRVSTMSMPAKQPLRNIPQYSVEIVSPESAAFEEICHLQAERFARAGAPSYPGKYLETVDVDPRRTIPLVARRPDGLMVGTLILELPPATVIESVIRFKPGSLAAQTLAKGTFGELRGFATREGTSREEALDIIDALAWRLVQLAGMYGLEWFWLVPRRPLMSALFFAQVPGLLLPCHFTLCMDVLGWNEDSPRLQQMRQLRLKEIALAPDTMPAMYQIMPAQWAEDLAARLALQEERHSSPDFPQLLPAAIREAHQQVLARFAQLGQSRQEETPMKPFSSKTKSHPLAQPEPVLISGESAQNEQPEPSSIQRPASFLPFASAVDKVRYLRQISEMGGAEIQRYKRASYDLLQIEPDMEILDVGCGVGVDLLPLAERVGPDGLVIGLERDPDLLQVARETCAGQPNARLVLGEAEALPFPSRSFNGVRADRVLQYISQPARVLAEIWRVLRHEGVVTLIEPDWKAVAVFPASAAGGNDDHALNAVLTWNQRQIPHGLIGRQLYSFLSQEKRWENIQVQVINCIFTAWPVADSMLLLTQSARKLAVEEPTLAADLDAWLQTMEAASNRGEFLVSFPLFLVRASKAIQNKQ
jgi:ubiquinone/menaquinone biosynthesis C-methylase UbiE